MSLIRRWFAPGALRVALAAVLMGAILHLCTTFMLARVGATAPYARVVRSLPVNEMRLLPPATPRTQLLPFESGDVLIAACAFDATTAPVQIQAVLPAPGWTLSLYSPTGTNFYTISGQDSRRTDVQLLLLPSGDEFVPVTKDLVGGQSRVLRITLPSKSGLALIRAPIPGQAWTLEVESDLRLSSCRQKPADARS